MFARHIKRNVLASGTPNYWQPSRFLPLTSTSTSLPLPLQSLLPTLTYIPSLLLHLPSHFLPCTTPLPISSTSQFTPLALSQFHFSSYSPRFPKTYFLNLSTYSPYPPSFLLSIPCPPSSLSLQRPFPPTSILSLRSLTYPFPQLLFILHVLLFHIHHPRSFLLLNFLIDTASLVRRLRRSDRRSFLSQSLNGGAIELESLQRRQIDTSHTGSHFRCYSNYY